LYLDNRTEYLMHGACNVSVLSFHSKCKRTKEENPLCNLLNTIFVELPGKKLLG